MKKTLIISILFIFSFCLAAPQADAASMAERLSGRILLQVEERGEAWYVYPDTLERYFLGYPADAFEIMRKLGLGATHEFITSHTIYPDHVLGKILIDVDDMGKAYYIYPIDRKAYFLGYPKDAFEIMRSLGLGITNTDLDQIPIADDSPGVSYKGTNLVTEVIDNNTFKLDDGLIFKLYGIADAEDMEIYVEESTAKLREMVLNKHITLENASQDSDTDGNLLFLVYVDGKEVNLDLVRQGYGLLSFDIQPENPDTYELALYDAVYGHLGLWGIENENIWVSDMHADAEGVDTDNLNDEYVTFTAVGFMNLTNWKIVDSDGNVFTSPISFVPPSTTWELTLHSGEGISFFSNAYWGSDKEIWDNDGDTLYLYDHNGKLVLEYSY